MNYRNLASCLTKAAAAMAVASTLALPQIAVGEETQYFPIASSRVGPYSAMGTGYYGAQIDYKDLCTIEDSLTRVKYVSFRRSH